MISRKHSAVIGLLFLGLAGAAKAQTPDCVVSKEDSINYSLMHEDVKIKRFDQAKEPWIKIFNSAPCFREQTFVDGAEMYLHFIKNTTDPVRKKELLDTLDLIYQKRIQYHGREGYAKGRWALDLMQLDSVNVYRAMKLIEESIALDSTNLENDLIAPYFKTLVSYQRAKRISKEEVLAKYETLTSIIDYNMKHQEGKEAKLGLYMSNEKILTLSENSFTVNKADYFEEGMQVTFRLSLHSPKYIITNIDSLDITVNRPITEEEGSDIYIFKEAWRVAQETVNAMAAPYLDCETLAGIYGPRFKAEPDNLELMSRIMLYLKNARCTKNSLYIDVAEAYLKINPNPVDFRQLGLAYRNVKNYAKAIVCFQSAVELETDPKKKVDDYINLARLALDQNNPSLTKSYADKALALDPNKGIAYMLIGDAYQRAASGCADAFERSAIYWVVVDQYIKAKSVDPGIAGAANRRIATYSRYFPTKEDAFFRSINEGDTYTLKCYPNLTTKARFVE